MGKSIGAAAHDCRIFSRQAAAGSTREGRRACSLNVIARSPCDEAIQNPSAEAAWIASAFAKGFGGQVASLAMTELDAMGSLFLLHLGCRHGSSASRLDPPELCLIAPPSNPGGHREDRVPAGTCGLLRERHAQRRPHSSIQVSPITRPSLRSGRTAYAVISREPTIPLASLAPRIWMMQSARLGSLAPSRKT